MPKKNKPPSIFKLALAARNGDIPVEGLTGAAKRIYNDTTLTTEQIKDYTVSKIVPTPRQNFGRTRSTFKRG